LIALQFGRKNAMVILSQDGFKETEIVNDLAKNSLNCCMINQKLTVKKFNTQK